MNEDDKNDFETRFRERREEAKKRSQDSFDSMFDALEESAQKVFQYYEKTRKDVIRMSFFLGLLGGLCGGTIVAATLWLFLS